MLISDSGTPDELLRQLSQKQPPPQIARLLLEVLAEPQGEPNSDQIAGLALVKLASANPDNRALLEELLNVLASDHTSILPRAYAARAVGGTKQASVVKPLAQVLLHSPNSHLRGAAAEGLGATTKSEAIEPLGQALLDPTEDEVVRCSVAGALSDIGQVVESERPHIAQLLRQALTSRPPATLRENISLALHAVDS